MLAQTDRSVKTGLINHALAIGRENHGHYKVMPKIGVISEPMEVNGWKFLPLEMDDSVIPREAWKQVEVLRENGIPIQQVIVGHNLKEEDEKRKKVEEYKGKIDGFRDSVATSAVAIFGIATWLVAASVALLVGFISLVLAVDPVLVVVLDDGGTWLCVAEWEA